MRKTVRYPLKAEDAGDNLTNVTDGEDVFLLYHNSELSLNQWQFIVAQLNEAAKQGKFIPNVSP